MEVHRVEALLCRGGVRFGHIAEGTQALRGSRKLLLTAQQVEVIKGPQGRLGIHAGRQRRPLEDERRNPAGAQPLQHALQRAEEDRAQERGRAGEQREAAPLLRRHARLDATRLECTHEQRGEPMRVSQRRHCAPVRNGGDGRGQGVIALG